MMQASSAQQLMRLLLLLLVLALHCRSSSRMVRRAMRGLSSHTYDSRWLASLVVFGAAAL
jgi:hypothetical protein